MSPQQKLEMLGQKPAFIFLPYYYQQLFAPSFFFFLATIPL